VELLGVASGFAALLVVRQMQLATTSAHVAAKPAALRVSQSNDPAIAQYR
jgi:hypothetical protein